MSLATILLFILTLLVATDSWCEEERSEPTILLTIYLKHDQSKTPGEINAQLERAGFWKKFPPDPRKYSETESARSHSRKP
ncbi:MAG TPA: hypothetical protein VGJ94_09495 [Syntrophorhabdaceae bacterium]